MKKKILLLVSMFFFHYSLSGQFDYRPGYILTNGNDTLKGFIDYRGAEQNSKTCKFKKDLSSDAIVYSPGQINAYRFENGKYYRSMNIPFAGGNLHCFLECLIKGKASVYVYFADSKSHFYVEKEGTLTELNRVEEPVRTENGANAIVTIDRYIGALKTTFSDCPGIWEKVDKVTLDRKSLIKISKEYHEMVCSNESCIIYEKKIKKGSNDFGVEVNRGFPTVSFDSYLEFKAPAKEQWFIGGMWRRNSGMYERLSGILSLGYYYVSTETGENIKLFGYHEKGDISYHFSTLRLQTSFQYVFSQGKWRPFISAGIPVNFILSEEGNVTWKFTLPKLPPVFSLDDNTYGRSKQVFLLGANGGIGLEHLLSDKLHVFVSLNYEIPISSVETVLTSHGWNLRGGIFF